MIGFLAGAQHQGLVRRQVGSRDQAVLGVYPLTVHVSPALANEPTRGRTGGGQAGFMKKLERGDTRLEFLQADDRAGNGGGSGLSSAPWDGARGQDVLRQRTAAGSSSRAGPT